MQQSGKPNLILHVFLVTGYFACGQEMWKARESIRDYPVGLDGPGLPTFHQSDLGPWLNNSKGCGECCPLVWPQSKGNQGLETLSSPDTNVKGIQESFSFPTRYCNKHLLNKFLFPLLYARHCSPEITNHEL